MSGISPMKGPAKGGGHEHDLNCRTRIALAFAMWERCAEAITKSRRQNGWDDKDHRAPSNTPRTSSTALRSVRKGTRSVSSVSCRSLNHDDTGTALLGWKIYEAGELSRIIVSAMGLPSCDKSWNES